MKDVTVSTHSLIKTPPVPYPKADVGVESRPFSAKPICWLGAPSEGGLMLPDARPTPSQLYAPRGVYFDDDVFIATDTGNHRVLIWFGMPNQDGQPADIVLGQQDFTSEGPQAGARGPANGVHLPTGVGIYDGHLYVADAWNHRVLVWNELPQKSDTPPDYALGQSNLEQVTENRGRGVDALGFYWPYGIAYIHDWFYVADTGNRRVLGWQGLPEPEQAPDLILGQDSSGIREENRGGAVSANSFRWPHALAGNGDQLYIADAGNHRLLGWSPIPTEDRAADVVIGQSNFSTAQEWPYTAQGPHRLRFPYAIAMAEQRLAVADTANNRILFWHNPPTEGAFQPADQVIGQPDFDAYGENHWKTVEPDSLCWPYGLHLHDNRLAIADSGNNRVMIWEIHNAE